MVRRVLSGYLFRMPHHSPELRHATRDAPALGRRATGTGARLELVAAPADDRLAARLDAELARPSSSLAGVRGAQPVDERDAALTLLRIHDLHVGPIGLLAGGPNRQHHPVIADLKWRLEAAYLERLQELDSRPAGDLPSDPRGALRAIQAVDRVPPLYRWLAEEADGRGPTCLPGTGGRSRRQASTTWSRSASSGWRARPRSELAAQLLGRDGTGRRDSSPHGAPPEDGRRPRPAFARAQPPAGRLPRPAAARVHAGHQPVAAAGVDRGARPDRAPGRAALSGRGGRAPPDRSADRGAAVLRGARPGGSAARSGVAGPGGGAVVAEYPGSAGASSGAPDGGRRWTGGSSRPRRGGWSAAGRCHRPDRTLPIREPVARSVDRRVGSVRYEHGGANSTATRSGSRVTGRAGSRPTGRVDPRVPTGRGRSRHRWPCPTEASCPPARAAPGRRPSGPPSCCWCWRSSSDRTPSVRRSRSLPGTGRARTAVLLLVACVAGAGLVAAVGVAQILQLRHRGGTGGQPDPDGPVDRAGSDLSDRRP